MDLITRDVFGAATALPTFSQSFTVFDPAGAGSCTTALDGCGVPGSLGVGNTDVLELLAADETCPFQTVCSAVTPGSAGLFVTMQPVPGCMALPGFVLLTDNTSFVVQPAQAVASPGADCGGGGVNGNLQLTASLAAWPPAGTMPNPTATPVFLYGARVVRYRIAPSGDPQDNSPGLWRSATGVYGTDGSVKPEPGDPSFTLGGGSPWQLVARGIEDLQVEYLSGTGWSNAPPLVVNTDYDTLVRRVRVTLSARVTAANLQGELAAGGAGPNAVRGQLVSEVAPRAVLNELQIGYQTTHFN